MDERTRTELEAAAFADIDASLRRLHDVAVEDLLVEGHLVRAGGLLSYDVRRHTIVFSVTALDPQPTSAWLEDRRQAVREAAGVDDPSERERVLQTLIAEETRLGMLVGVAVGFRLARELDRAALAADPQTTETTKGD